MATIITPDLTGLSLSGAYQAGVVVGFTQFSISLVREAPMSNANVWGGEDSPAVGYVAEVTSIGAGGRAGSLYSNVVGNPDQAPAPGVVVDPSTTSLRFTCQIATTDVYPGIGHVTGAYATYTDGQPIGWYFTFAASALSTLTALVAALEQYAGLPFAETTPGITLGSAASQTGGWVNVDNEVTVIQVYDQAGNLRSEIERVNEDALVGDYVPLRLGFGIDRAYPYYAATEVTPGEDAWLTVDANGQPYLNNQNVTLPIAVATSPLWVPPFVGATLIHDLDGGNATTSDVALDGGSATSGFTDVLDGGAA